MKCVILAAGYGKRLGGNTQKVIHKLLGKPILLYLLETIRKLEFENIIIVVGYKKEEVFKELKDFDNIEYVEQPVLLGTGDAVKRTEKILKDYKGDILVLCGDTPFLREETLRKLCKIHQNEKSVCTILTAIVEDPTGYGRIKRDKNGKVIEIVEEVDATPEEKKIKEINGGVYVFNTSFLFPALSMIKKNPLKGEYFLTDVIKILSQNTHKISTYSTPTPQEILGINTVEDLKRAEEILKRGEKWMIA